MRSKHSALTTLAARLGKRASELPWAIARHPGSSAHPPRRRQPSFSRSILSNPVSAHSLIGTGWSRNKAHTFALRSAHTFGPEIDLSVLFLKDFFFKGTQGSERYRDDL